MSSEELPLADVHALTGAKRRGQNPDYANYVQLQAPKNSKNKMTRHESYDLPSKNPGLSVMVRRLSDPVVPAKPPQLSNSRKSPMLLYPNPKQSIPSHHHTNSNSSGSFYGSEGDPILYERNNSVYQSQPSPDKTHENTPLKGRSGSPRSKGRKNELKVFDYPSGGEGHPRFSDSSEGSRHQQSRDKHKHRSKDGKSKPQKPSKGKQNPTGNGPKQRRGISYDKHPDIAEVLGEADYESALDYNREQETQFLNSVYDSMYDDTSLHTSQLHSSIDSNPDSMYSHSPHRHSPHRYSPHSYSPHKQNPHRHSPRLLSPPEVIIPQRLDFDDSGYDKNLNMSPHRQSPYDNGQRSKSPSHNQVKDRSRSPSKLKREPYFHIKSDKKASRPSSRGPHPHNPKLLWGIVWIETLYPCKNSQYQ